MATDALTRRTPLGDLGDELAQACTGLRFSAREDDFRVLTEVRIAAAATAAADAVGADLPGVGRAIEHEGRFVVGLGPGWWMVDAPAGTDPIQGSAIVSAVEVSAQRTPLVMRGNAVREVLAHGCSLDLHPDFFVVGAAAQTLVAKAGVIIARTGDDEYRLWVRASFARYFATWLIDAAAEYR